MDARRQAGGWNTGAPRKGASKPFKLWVALPPPLGEPQPRQPLRDAQGRSSRGSREGDTRRMAMRRSTLMRLR